METLYWLLKETNNALATKYLIEAASTGIPEFRSLLAEHYFCNRTTEIDRTKVLTSIITDFNLGGTKSAWFMGIMYRDGNCIPKDESMSFVWFNKHMDAGGKLAYLDIAKCYFFGRGTIPDYQKARQYFLLEIANHENGFHPTEATTRIKEFDYENSNYYLGCIYENGYGVKKNMKEAIKYYRKGIYDPRSRTALQALTGDWRKGISSFTISMISEPID